MIAGITDSLYVDSGQWARWFIICIQALVSLVFIIQLIKYRKTLPSSIILLKLALVSMSFYAMDASLYALRIGLSWDYRLGFWMTGLVCMIFYILMPERKRHPPMISMVESIHRSQP